MRTLFCLLLAVFAAASAFTVQAPLRSAVAPRAPAATMGKAQDGPFTPAVLAAKVVLGEKTLGKVRGKAIAYHSQEINKFCEECECRTLVTPTLRPRSTRLPARPPLTPLLCRDCVPFLAPTDGVPKKLNQALIKKAKVVGSTLGFLS